MAESYAFRVALSQVGPVSDPAFAHAPGGVKKALLRAVVDWVLGLKDDELEKGLDKDGAPMVPIAQSTRDDRHSAMGPADPNAAPLDPAHGLSRTRSLLDGRAHPDHALFFWRYDPHTQGPWGKVLGYHRAGAGHLPVRDVIGASPAILTECRARARDWWHKYRTTGQIPAPAPPPSPTPAAPTAATPPPAFTTFAVPAYKPQVPAHAAPKSPHRVSQLGVNGHVYTFGAALNGKTPDATAAGVKRGIANGSFSGFKAWGPGEAEAAIAAFKQQFGKGGAGPAAVAKPPPPPPPPPPPAPVQHPTVHARVAKPEGRPSTFAVPPNIPLPVKPKAKPKAKPAGPKFPASVAGLKDVKPLGGHGGGQATLVTDAKGNQWVRKSGAVNPGQLREEVAADAIYRAAGVGVAPSKVYEGATPYKLAAFVKGTTLGELRRTDPTAAAAAEAEVRKGFVVDALLGNWDVIGADADNVLVTPDGKVLRIDNGGALRYRAQGAKKSPAQWSGTVGELDSLRSAATNPAAAKVFGALTDAEVKAQAKAVVKKRAAILKAAPADLHDVLGQRLDFLEALANAKPPKPVKGFKPQPASAFKEFPAHDTHAMDAYGKSHYGAWGKSLTASEVAAVRSYTGSGYKWMNATLRAVDFTEARQEAQKHQVIKTLADALERARTPENLVLWRGVRDYQDLKLAGLHGIKPGLIIEDGAFTSMSLSREVARDEFAGYGPRAVLFRVHAPAGTPGGYMNATKGSSVTREKELLVPPGRARYRVVSVDATASPPVVTVELVP